MCVMVLLVACGGEQADDKGSDGSQADAAASRAVAKLGKLRAELAELAAELPKAEAAIAKASTELAEATTDTDRVAAKARLDVHQGKQLELEALRERAQDEIDRLTGKGGVSGAIAKLEEFSSKMCACRDKACADGVNRAYTQWGTEMARRPSPRMRVTCRRRTPTG